jgi:hypothetical protein
MNSRGMRLAGNVLKCRVLVEKQKSHLVDPDKNRRIILNWILMKCGGIGQTDISDLEQGQAAGYCKVGNKALIP